MKQRCLACGVEKDTSVEEVYPFPEDGIMDDKPICAIDGYRVSGNITAAMMNRIVLTFRVSMVLILLKRVWPDLTCDIDRQ